MLVGPPGVGKIHLALSLAVAAAERGHHVNFTTLVDLLQSLEGAQAAGRLAQQLRTLVIPSLMIVDEIGYLPITRTGVMLFFQLMTRRYEHASTVLTSNKGLEEWGEVFGDEVMTAHVDRLVHHCHIVNIRRNSYRLLEHADLARRLHGVDAGTAALPPTDPRRRRNGRAQEVTDAL